MWKSCFGLSRSKRIQAETECIQSELENECILSELENECIETELENEFIEAEEDLQKRAINQTLSPNQEWLQACLVADPPFLYST